LPLNGGGGGPTESNCRWRSCSAGEVPIIELLSLFGVEVKIVDGDAEEVVSMEADALLEEVALRGGGGGGTVPMPPTPTTKEFEGKIIC